LVAPNVRFSPFSESAAVASKADSDFFLNKLISVFIVFY
jgi:hypothetical protein